MLACTRLCALSRVRSWLFCRRRLCAGWYYKLIGPYTDDIIVVIPGVLINHVNSSHSEAFITVVHNAQVNYYRFPVSAFHATKQASGFTVTVGDSTFTETGLTLSIMPDEDDDANANAVMGEITFEDMTPWTVRQHADDARRNSEGRSTSMRISLRHQAH
jgi:hypothetical protein